MGCESGNGQPTSPVEAYVQPGLLIPKQFFFELLIGWLITGALTDYFSGVQNRTFWGGGVRGVGVKIFPVFSLVGFVAVSHKVPLAGETSGLTDDDGSLKRTTRSRDEQTGVSSLSPGTK